ncbi:hypothetical protein E1262_17150 [Jiangella aurantiaca]|uniref:Ferritin-like domain-containing protein n=1 Tax=Jiangella aurantiaca TaxID=2530373 RepID=A0A4R5ADK1_9ACTN|nr:hypothetical protein [Jiangella aurantiaca]TDD67942.1 hypothetical protein E1262_17150 [Jiangella aurantiaca]
MTQRVDEGRRRLLALVAGAPVLAAALAACGADPRPKAAPGPRAPLDADVKLRWRAVHSEQTLLALHAATVAAYPDLAARLQPLTAHHDEHLAALRADGPLPYGGGDGTAAAPEVAADPAAALAAVADAERAAADACVVAALAAAGPRLAAVLASIAASEAGHGVVLA